MNTCIICEEELYEPLPGIDGWADDGTPVNESYVVRSVECTRDGCPLCGESQDIFFNFDRIDIGGNPIDVEALKTKYSMVIKAECPECLNTVTQHELDTFGGLCEECNMEK